MSKPYITYTIQIDVPADRNPLEFLRSALTDSLREEQKTLNNWENNQSSLNEDVYRRVSNMYKKNMADLNNAKNSIHIVA